MNIKKSVLFILLILIIDQWSKIYIKTNFVLGESVEVFSWFKILFIENEGAAWGAKLSDVLPISDNIGKLVLTIFRLFAILGIGYWLFDVIKKKASNTLIWAVSLIFAGALGNILDSVFYGAIFNGGQNFRFFEPVFNIADTAISTGVGILLVFNKRAFNKEEKVESSISEENSNRTQEEVNE